MAAPHEFLGASYCVRCGQERNAHPDPVEEAAPPVTRGAEQERTTPAGQRVEDGTERPLPTPEPFGPSREGSPHCQSGSLASGGNRTYCTCDVCF